MKEVKNYIEENTLPLELNFVDLREKALAYIQRHNDGTWTNLNQSDPGVTILDQLCFALTELGYCNDFPIKDILTDRKGNLEINNQFYLPEDILTTTPVTINDFRKYVIDQVKEVVNVQITPVQSNLSIVNGVYEVEVLIDPKIDTAREVPIVTYKNNEEIIVYKTVLELILNNTFFVLNTCRNLGELFLYPTQLVSEPHSVYGKLEIAYEQDIDAVVVNIEYAINNYVFPEVKQEGYDKLKLAGKTSNEIFNGPKLQNGWILDHNLREKKNTIQAFELAEVIQNVSGVISVSNVAFNKEGTLLEVNCKEKQLLVFDFIEAIKDQKKEIEFFRKGREVNRSITRDIIQELSNLTQPEEQICKVSTVKMYPTIPKGNYRDIASYYSIQNTFPEVYAVGVEGVSSNATAFQRAQSRQLKGYLTLFDQVLTNQFMQLANLGTLFSFENAITGDPVDRDQFYRLQNCYEKKHQQYPAPYLSFSPTYFYQSLYETVPHIRPLLRNFRKHEYSYEPTPAEQLIYNGWSDYKDDPYNSYIWGLMYFMEDENINIERRNKILNHLLARHGQSPEVIDRTIEGSIYSGNTKKDQVIIKSLYLQNLGFLSYYRTKAYNFIGAGKLRMKYVEESPELPTVFYNKLKHKLVQGHQKDFIFKTVEINKAMQLNASDFIDFSAVELKLNLLFSLNAYYQDYLITTNSSYAYWLLKRRKGLLCIEMDLLIESADFEITLTEDGIDIFWIITEKLSYSDVLKIEGLLKKGATIDELRDNYTFEKLETFDIDAQEFKSIISSSCSWHIKLKWGANLQLPIDSPLLINTLLFIFPSFFIAKEGVKIPDFKKRLNYFLQGDLPIQVCYESYFLEDDKLKEVIIAYTNWYNNLRFDQETGNLHSPDLVTNAITLIEVLLTLNPTSND
ncbi:hypothetical protein [Tenacibaculum agarivorans]|uniref:hypothetical protein n=1 Tax=Tenacibaculum agarivorans TaxID=1908389 RepID=UPI00094BC355|nr:hypothetical protein [Tenacibaculum agarivorans]